LEVDVIQTYATAILAALLMLTGCTTVPGNTDAMVTQLDGPLAQLQVDTKQLYQRLQRLTTDKSCVEDQQCKVLAVGSRPCGGPEQYLPYSVAQTDSKLLAITNDRYRKIKQEQQLRLGMLGSCQMLIEPATQCRQQQCVLIER
jgi:hypothetical protein